MENNNSIILIGVLTDRGILKDSKIPITLKVNDMEFICFATGYDATKLNLTYMNTVLYIAGHFVNYKGRKVIMIEDIEVQSKQKQSTQQTKSQRTINSSRGVKTTPYEAKNTQTSEIKVES